MPCCSPASNRQTLDPGSPFRFFPFGGRVRGRGRLASRALMQVRYCRYSARPVPKVPTRLWSPPRWPPLDPVLPGVPSWTVPRRPRLVWIFSSPSPQSETRHHTSRTLFAPMAGGFPAAHDSMSEERDGQTQIDNNCRSNTEKRSPLTLAGPVSAKTPPYS